MTTILTVNSFETDSEKGVLHIVDFIHSKQKGIDGAILKSGQPRSCNCHRLFLCFIRKIRIIWLWIYSFEFIGSYGTCVVLPAWNFANFFLFYTKIYIKKKNKQKHNWNNTSRDHKHNVEYYIIVCYFCEILYQFYRLTLLSTQKT